MWWRRTVNLDQVGKHGPTMRYEPTRRRTVSPPLADAPGSGGSSVANASDDEDHANLANRFMPKTSAGLLMYRIRDEGVDVLLVHLGGPFWQKKDLGAWFLPKGELEPGEDPLAAARREFEEETGGQAVGTFMPRGDVRQKSGKVVMAWAVEGDWNPARLESNTFTMEWPPKSGRQREFPEIDRAAFFSIPAARRKIHPAEEPFLDRLIEQLRRPQG